MGSRRSADFLARFAVAVASSVNNGEVQNIFFLPRCTVKGEVMYMDYVTWSEFIRLLTELVTLAFIIVSYFNSKKR